MDCSLSTWPSITQFDDLTWMGLGDIDPLETLDRSFDNDSQITGTSFSNPGDTKLALPATKVSPNDSSGQLLHTKSDDFYRLTSAESLAAARWESINAVDLASVLDKFPPNNDTPTPGEEDVYDLYSESMVMQAEPPVAQDVDVFMSDSMSELADANNTVVLSDDKSSVNDTAVISSDCTPLSSSEEDVKHEVSVVDNDSPASVNGSVSGSLYCSLSQVVMENPMSMRGDGNARHVDHMENKSGGSRACYSIDPMKSLGDANRNPSTQHASNPKDPSAPPQRRDYIQPNMRIHWSQPHPTLVNTQLYDREQVVQHSPMHIGDNYPALLDQQARMADAARVTSELKRNRAQASRARRLAATQRRAKKYPLQKLIRMSSSSANTRDKLEQNLSNAAAAMPHQPSQLVSQSQPITNSQLPTFLPVVLQGTHLAPSHELLSHATALQSAPYYHYQHPSTAHYENSLVSPSASTTLQPMHNDQNVRALSTIPSLAASHSANSIQSLDVILLNQLQSIITKMNVDMRLCIRDAMYRLARSAKHRQSRAESVSYMDVNASHLEEMETNTNSIDRWIVNMLFCKQPAPYEANSQPYISQAPDHSMENANTNSNMQQWNSCGSSMNLQDQPLHVMTGL